MAPKQRKPTNPGSRFQEYASFTELSGVEAHKPLVKGRKRGRRSQ